MAKQDGDGNWFRTVDGMWASLALRVHKTLGIALPDISDTDVVSLIRTAPWFKDTPKFMKVTVHGGHGRIKQKYKNWTVKRLEKYVEDQRVVPTGTGSKLLRAQNTSKHSEKTPPKEIDLESIRVTEHESRLLAAYETRMLMHRMLVPFKKRGDETDIAILSRLIRTYKSTLLIRPHLQNLLQETL